MSTRQTYGLAPYVWRALRAKHPGMDLTLYDRAGLSIGIAHLHRYESMVTLPEGLDFRAVSWKQTIERTSYTRHGMLDPTPLPIGARTWG